MPANNHSKDEQQGREIPIEIPAEGGGNLVEWAARLVRQDRSEEVGQEIETGTICEWPELHASASNSRHACNRQSSVDKYGCNNGANREVLRITAQDLPHT
ncbi:hypothetical protein NMY22_g18195 [Coprinellus aureogranulatus]|nr:hypothetical protein NMY22_g18195 [Coprinellus aureogranulatus]